MFDKGITQKQDEFSFLLDLLSGIRKTIEHNPNMAQSIYGRIDCFDAIINLLTADQSYGFSYRFYPFRGGWLAC